jgi:4-hydroxy-3-methylbut-2-enyl diphosphate reductase
MQSTYTRKGFGLKNEILETLEKEYQSSLIDQIKASDWKIKHGQTTIKLAKEYGFCYGVDRSIDYAYQTVKKFPDKKIYLTGEIIHNPFVNKRLIDMGVRFLSGQYSKGESITDIKQEDVVILPAFGVAIPLLEELKKIGCILVDTTCGSVLNVWKHVTRFSRDHFTALVHGKYYHEETLATVSQTNPEEGGKYIIVRDFKEADRVCDYIRSGDDKITFLKYFANKISAQFDPEQDLVKIGVANQTTMLANESLQIAEKVKQALSDRYGADKIEDHFRSFDTICSATQERQDAILQLLDTGVDLTVVIGGFNSSNTNNLTNIALNYGPAFHVEDVSDLSKADQIRHKIPNSDKIEITSQWLPQHPLTIGVTAGASTPDSKIDEIIKRILKIRGEEA